MGVGCHRVRQGLDDVGRDDSRHWRPASLWRNVGPFTYSSE